MSPYEKMLAVVFALILLGELYTVTQPSLVVKTSVSVSDITYLDGKKAEITYSVDQGTYPNTLAVALLRSYQLFSDRHIYTYYDENYPSSMVALASWLGIIDHLDENLRLKGYVGSTEVVNAARLRELMLQEYDSVVIIPSGVFPETVHTRESSLVKQYLEMGGIIIWIGDYFAAFLGKYGNMVNGSSTENPGFEAQQEILGYTISNASSLESAGNASLFSHSLNLRYPGIQRGILVDEVVKHGGLVLGMTNGDRTSIGLVPVGNGYLVIFGGKVTTARSEFGEDIVASDIANILLSGVAYSNGEVTYHMLERNSVRNQTMSFDLNDSQIKALVLLVISSDAYSYFFFRKLITLN